MTFLSPSMPAAPAPPPPPPAPPTLASASVQGAGSSAARAAAAAAGGGFDNTLFTGEGPWSAPSTAKPNLGVGAYAAAGKTTLGQ